MYDSRGAPWSPVKYDPSTGGEGATPITQSGYIPLSDRVCHRKIDTEDWRCFGKKARRLFVVNMPADFSLQTSLFCFLSGVK